MDGMGDEEMRNLKFYLMAAGTVLMLSSCASFKKSFCDCAQAPKESKSAATTEHAKSSAVTDKSSTKEAGIVVDSADVDMGNRMSRAVDAFVFKNQREEFTSLCKDERFDCYVNDKRYPKGRKKVKRKVPPFLSGSKMGLQGDERVRVRYNFYP